MRLSFAFTLLLVLAGPVISAPREANAAIALAAADAVKLGPAAVYTRYFWIPPYADPQTLWQVLSGVANGQSREPNIIPPYLVLDDGTLAFWWQLRPQDWQRVVLLRIDLQWYRWSKKTFDQLGVQDNIFHVTITEPSNKDKVTGKPIVLRDGKWVFSDKPETIQALSPTLVEVPQHAANLVTLINATQAKTPILPADNFIWQIGIQKNRVVGYYGLIDINNEKDFNRAIGYDPKADVDPSFLDEMLAAVSATDSGVSINSRRIERRNKIGEGARWATFDNSDNKTNRNPLRFLNGGFVFAATETYGNLANGLWAFGLFTGNIDDKGKPQQAGVRQDSAPDFVGRDSTTHNNDGRIHIGLGCCRCHTDGGLQDIRDWFRKMNPAGLGVQVPFDKKLLEVQARYVRRLEPHLDRDRNYYAAALFEANGLKPAEFARKLGTVYAAYDDGVTLGRAAADCGVTPEILQERFGKFLKAAGYQDTVLGMLLLPAGKRSKITTEDWLETKNLSDLVIRGLASWPVDIKNQAIKVGEIK